MNLLEVNAVKPTAETWEASNDDYHASPGVSNSKLNDFIDDPLLYYHYHVAKDWQRPEPTKDMLFGTAVHEMLPPGSPSFVVIPREVLNKDGHRKGSGWERFANLNAGKQLVKPDEVEEYLGIIQRAKENPKAMWVLESPYVEMNIRWKDEKRGFEKRARLDRLRMGTIIADIKTTKATSAKEFSAEVFRNGYHRQAAFYQEAAFALTGDSLPFVFVACRKSRPYSVEVYEIDDDFIRLGREELDAALDRLKICLDTGTWESESHGSILTLSPPAWAKFENQWSL